MCHRKPSVLLLPILIFFPPASAPSRRASDAGETSVPAPAPATPETATSPLATSPPPPPSTCAPTPPPPAYDGSTAAVLEGELEARRLTLSFLWYKRTFALFPDFTFSRYDGAELCHSTAITHSTTVSKLGRREFVLTFAQLELRYHIRAATCDERDRWVAALQSFINRASAAALSPAAAAPPP